ncbi:MAG: DUF2804 domain-containing protein [Aquihabitans sp.]
MEPVANTTREREITAPVQLCLPDGRTLNPAAEGWSRLPLHTGNLRGSWGRTKRWDYWAILAGDLVLSFTYADVDYLGMASVAWIDLATGTSGGHDSNLPLGHGISLPDQPGTTPLRYHGKSAALDIADDGDGNTITASWTERDGRPATAQVRVELPEGHESLNVVIPWSEKRFQYTSKHQARPASGTLTLGDDVRSFDDAWGVLDVGRGRWPYSTRWNWGAGAGHSQQGSIVGLQFGAKWTEGTGFTENGVIVDGRLTKIGEELDWTYQWDEPMEPWRVRHPNGSLDVTLTPSYDRHAKVSALLLATEVHQVFGRWDGHVTSEDGIEHHFTDVMGFAEESRSRW